MEQQYDRFKDVIWFPKKDIHVLIGGAGGIGSWTVFLLARAGFKPIVYDFDTLEAHNLGGQLYAHAHVGLHKVEALSHVCVNFAGQTIFAEKTTYNENSMTHEFCIAAFDNIKARRDMYKLWLAKYRDDTTALFIDSRLEIEQMFIYCIRGSDSEAQAEYQKELDAASDEDIEEASCTEKQTSHGAAMIASHIVGFFTNHIANLVDSRIKRVVPYRWEYFIPIDLLTN